MEIPSVTIYDADAAPSGLASWSEMVRDLVRSRELIWRFVARDFATRYKQSLLGYVWVLGPPIATVVVFTFLTRTRVLQVGDTGIPYPAFLLLGLTVWGLFSTGVSNMATSLTSASSVIQKMNFPRESLVIASFGQALYETAIRGVVLGLIFLYYGVSIRWTALLVPLALVPLLLVTLGAGFLLATLNALVRDVSSALSLTLQFGLFLTPIVYPAPTSWPLVLLNYVNPVSAFVIAAQDLVSHGRLTMPIPFVSSSLVGLLLVLVGWRVFRLAQPIIGERI